MPVQSFQWIQVFLINGFNFFTKDFFFDEKIRNQVGQYGIRLFPAPVAEFYLKHSENSDKIIIKKSEDDGFNPDKICNYKVIRKEVEVLNADL
ncbi:MAG: hypothetical protein ACFFDN_46725 [Candidatus Hodarchaeota archaeon]